MKKIRVNKNALIADSICILILLVMECIFLRGTLFNAQMYGDLGDGRLCALITERWYSVFSGKVSWDNSLMFYPEPSLGYTDLFFGYGIIHSIFRVFGLDMYISFKLTIQIVHIFGIFSLFYLLSGKLKVRRSWSLLGTVAFSFCSSYISEWVHPQLSCISVVPLLAIFIVSFFENYNVRLKRNLSAVGIILTFMFIIYTAWYIAFFTIVFVMLFAVSAILLFYFKKKEAFSSGFQTFKKNHPIDYIWYIVLTVIMMIPFIKIYLPVINGIGESAWAEVAYYLPEPADFINVTGDNVIFGKLIENMGLAGRGLSGEQDIGISIVTLVLFAVSLKASAKRKKTTDKISDILIYACGIAVALGMLFVVKLSSNGISLWYIIYKIVPGASSLRAIDRFVAFLVLPMTVFISVCLGKKKQDGEQTEKTNSVPKVAVTILSILIFISDMRISGLTANWSSTERLYVLSQTSAIPENAESFYIIDTSGNKNVDVVNQLNAYEISIVNNIPALNGYSGKTPQEWGMENIYDYEYIVNANNWRKKYSLHNVYVYDLGTNAWTEHVFTPHGFEGNPLEIYFSEGESNFKQYVISGMSYPEPGSTWTDGDSVQVEIPVNGDYDSLNVKIEVAGTFFEQPYEIEQNGKKITEGSLDGAEEISFNAKVTDNMLKFDILCPGSLVVSQVTESTDNRKVAFRFSKMIIEASEDL